MLSGTALGRVAAENTRLIGRLGVACTDAMTLAGSQRNPEEQSVLPARVDALAVTGCSFSGVVAGVVIAGACGTALLQANTVSDAAGGIWMVTDRSRLASQKGAPVQLLRAALASSANAGFALVMTELYPLPSAVAARNIGTVASPTLRLVDNLLAAVPEDGGGSLSGLLIAAMTNQNGPDPSATVIVNGNQVFSSGQVPTVWIDGVLGGAVVTGNLFMNRAANRGVTTNTKPYCFLVRATLPPMAGSKPAAPTLTVSGNTLRGTHNLASNPRPGFNAPLNDWSFANATL